MSNVLFVPSVAASQWVKDVLPGTSPVELPIAGRRIIDYLLECAHKYDVTLSEILDWERSEKLAADFEEPTRTEFPVFYDVGAGSVPRSITAIEGLSTPLTQNIEDGLVVIWGLCFPDKFETGIPVEPLSDEELADTPTGVYRRKDGRWVRVKACVTEIDGVRTWHELSLRVLNNPDVFTIPGYSAEKGVYLGRNVALEHRAEVKPPALLMDDSWCARNVVLLGDVVIGSGAYVGEGSVLRRTVVCDHTYVGEGLDLDGKIVYGNRIIDGESGAWTDVEDPGIARGIGAEAHGSGFVRAMLSALCRFLHGTSRGRRG